MSEGLIVNQNETLLSMNDVGLDSLFDANLSVYIDRVNAIPMLSLEEEIRLTMDYYQNKNQVAANAIVMAHLRVVVKVARKFSGYNLPLMDLICEGNLGLIKAVTKFDPNKGFRFVTYAVWWIKAAIQEYIMKSWSIVKIGTSGLHRKSFFNQGKDKMNSINGNTLMQKDISISDDSDLFASNEDYIENIDKRAKIKLILNAMNDLSDRERQIFYMRNITNPQHTLDDISKMFNISKERVRQICENVTKKIRVKVGQ